MWGLSSLTKDWNHDLCIISMESWPLDHQKVPLLAPSMVIFSLCLFISFSHCACLSPCSNFPFYKNIHHIGLGFTLRTSTLSQDPEGRLQHVWVFDGEGGGDFESTHNTNQVKLRAWIWASLPTVHLDSAFYSVPCGKSFQLMGPQFPHCIWEP